MATKKRSFAYLLFPLCSLGLFIAAQAPVYAQNTKETLYSRVRFCERIIEKKQASPEEKAKLITYLSAKKDTVNWALNFEDTADEVTRSSAARALMMIGEEGISVLREWVDKSPTLRGKVEAIVALRSDPKYIGDPVLRKKMEMLFPAIQKEFEPDPVGSELKNFDFQSNNISSDWTFHEQEKGQGQVSYDKSTRRAGSGSIKMEKFSSGGEIYIRSKQLFDLKKGETCLVRMYFNTYNASELSACQILFEDEKGRVTAGKDEYYGEAQTLLRNATPGDWIKRTAKLQATENTRFFIRIVLRGNPVTVKLDDIELPAINRSFNLAPMETLASSNQRAPAEPLKPVSAEIKTIDNRSRLVVDGKVVPPILHFAFGSKGNFGDYAAMETYGKIKLQTYSVQLNDAGIGLPGRVAIWPKNKVFNFTEVLERFEFAAKNAPESKFLIGFMVRWPDDWIEKHPDQTWQNASGQRGYGDALLFKGFTDALPAGGRWWPSPFSVQALDDAKEGIRLFVEALKKSKYANRVIGCHIAGGHDGQFNTSNHPDYSSAAVTAFQQWLKAKYINADALKKAWNDKSVNFDNAKIPDYSAVPNNAAGIPNAFYDPLVFRKYADHKKFQSERGMIIRDQLAGAFKDAMGRPVIGLTWAMGGGRGQGTEPIFMQSKNLDALIPQPSYARRLPGISGGLRNVALSSFAVHGKMLIKELDLRTWLRNATDETYAQRLSTDYTPAMFETSFKKEAAQMITKGLGFWMYDIGRTHFRDPEMLETIASGVKAYQETELLNQKPFKPEIAVVFSDESQYWEASPLRALDGNTGFDLGASGLVFDDLYLADVLKYEKCQDYKMFIIKDAWLLTDEQRSQIAARLQKDKKTIVWNYASGYIHDEGLSDRHISKLTGIDIRGDLLKKWPVVKYSEGKDPLLSGLSGITGVGLTTLATMGKGAATPGLMRGLHRFVVSDKQATVLARYEDNEPAVAVKRFGNWTSVYFGMLGTLDGRLLSNIAAQAGVHVFTKPGYNVEYSGNMLSVHSLYNGPVQIHLPSPAHVTDMSTGKEIAKGSAFTINTVSGQTDWFKIQTIN
ncbi:hypothetical protein ABIE26_001530 [Pedobacter africanus]|uniref:Uncharacterized protein n=1 Tax=Pedobacter africanus TaxID=151894 RepID=A0ACC6KSA6_9SPHI|nr:hypothetical protein [Pedobacter africanus]MDR6781981.1 hypothetical protein [Pedobacter africanus]